MRKALFRIFYFILLVFILSKCTKIIETENEPPTIVITQPEEGTILYQPVIIIAESDDNEGLSMVDFYIDTLLINSDEEPEYESYLNPFYYSDGNTHLIKAIAIDIAGNECDTSAVEVFIPEGLQNFPELVQPEDHDFIINGNVIQFIWNSYIDASSYNLIISKDFEFNEIIHNISIDDTTYTYIPEETGLFFWKVRAVDQFSNHGSWSIINTFYYHNLVVFNKMYEPIDYCRITKALQLGDGSFLALGNYSVYERTSKTILLKTDELGNKQWCRIFDSKDWNTSADIVKTDDDCFMLTGYNNPDTLTYGFEMMMVKVDQNGEVLWDKTFPTEYSNRSNAIIKTNDGGFALIGEQREENYYHTRMIKTDRSGNPEWEYLSVNWVQSGYGLIQTDSGSYLLISECLLDPYSSSYLICTKLDNDGSLVWHEYYFFPFENEINSGYIQKSDNGYIIAGQNIHDIYIIEIDEDGQVIWEREHDFEDRYYIRSLEKTFDNNYIMVGWSDIGYYVDPKLWICKIDNLGEILWKKIFQYNDLMSFGYSGFQCFDGGFIIGGHIDRPSSKMWLIKTDENGDIDPKFMDR